MTTITRRKALALVPPAIVALVPFTAPAKAITVRKVCPTERFWANFQQARKEYIKAGLQPVDGSWTSPKCIEARERMNFNENLLRNAVPTTIGGMIALSEHLYDFMAEQPVYHPYDEQIIIVSHLIASLKQLPS